MKRILLLVAMAVTSACGSTLDVTQAVQVDVVTSGWLTAGVVDGKNKIVPAVALTLKNVSGQTLNGPSTILPGSNLHWTGRLYRVS